MDLIKVVVQAFKRHHLWSDYTIRSSDKHIIWKDTEGQTHDSTVETLEVDLCNFERYYVLLMKDSIQ